MLDHGVQKYQFITFGIEREIGILHRFGVETDQMSLLSEDGSELIHDTTFYPHIIMLSALSNTGKLKLIDTEIQQIVQGISVSAL